MSTLVEHARRELELCGQTAEDPGFAASLVAAVAAFASYGHSGGSAGCAVEQLGVLLRFGALSPLTDDADEWLDRTAESGTPMWQSRRCPAAFSDDCGWTFWLLDDSDGLTGHPPLGEQVGERHGLALYRTAPANLGRP